MEIDYKPAFNSNGTARTITFHGPTSKYALFQCKYIYKYNYLKIYIYIYYIDDIYSYHTLSFIKSFYMVGITRCN
jgi:hypothetical protein